MTVSVVAKLRGSKGVSALWIDCRIEVLVIEVVFNGKEGIKMSVFIEVEQGFLVCSGSVGASGRTPGSRRFRSG